MARPGDVANLMLERDDLRRQLMEERAAHNQTINTALTYTEKAMAHINTLEQHLKALLDDIAAITKGGKASK